MYLDEEVLDFLANYADEFLVHGVDVEGKKYVLNCQICFFHSIHLYLSTNPA